MPKTPIRARALASHTMSSIVRTVTTWEPMVAVFVVPSAAPRRAIDVSSPT